MQTRSKARSSAKEQIDTFIATPKEKKTTARAEAKKNYGKLIRNLISKVPLFLKSSNMSTIENMDCELLFEFGYRLQLESIQVNLIAREKAIQQSEVKASGHCEEIARNFIMQEMKKKQEEWTQAVQEIMSEQEEKLRIWMKEQINEEKKLSKSRFLAAVDRIKKQIQEQTEKSKCDVWTKHKEEIEAIKRNYELKLEQIEQERLQDKLQIEEAQKELLEKRISLLKRKDTKMVTAILEEQKEKYENRITELMDKLEQLQHEILEKSQQLHAENCKKMQLEERVQKLEQDLKKFLDLSKEVTPRHAFS